MRPHPQHANGFLLNKDFVHDAVLDADAARIRASKITDQLLERHIRFRQAKLLALIEEDRAGSRADRDRTSGKTSRPRYRRNWRRRAAVSWLIQALRSCFAAFAASLAPAQTA